MSGSYKIDGDVKNSTGNGVGEELTCMTHGHELKRELLEGRWVPGRKGQRRKNWDNCNNIINKIYLKNKESISLTLELSKRKSVRQGFSNVFVL